jgi:hypothetical protein
MSFMRGSPAAGLLLKKSGPAVAAAQEQGGLSAQNIGVQPGN